ncbi:MAG: DUF2225 domain-containing protein [Lachnospiraceae bacterium]|nr:DUF2225 domain-containing protein [Lachnospiraceae bacterium]
MGLLSGLNGLGLGNFEDMDLYAPPVRDEEEEIPEEKPAAPAKPAAPEIKESDYVFEKSYTCPVCNKEFKALTVKANRARLTGTDRDLRPRYENIEPLKYDVVMCPTCGCASITRYWQGITDAQRKRIKEGISVNFVSKKYTDDTYSFDQALERYQMALANAMVKQAKPAEKAYICLRAGWTLRSRAENLDPDAADYQEEYERTRTMERDFLENALEGFVTARATDTPPICGMDDMTLDYLIAALSVEFGKYEQAAKLVGSLLTNRNISSRMKNKTLELKDDILKATRKK